MPELAWVVIKYLWPFALAFAVWGWQEVRITALDVSLAASHKRETAAVSKADADEALLAQTRQRATDLALLYASVLPRAEEAAKQQKDADDEKLAALQAQLDSLSRAPTLHFSPAAVRVWDDVSAFANGRDARPAAGSASGADPVPAAPAPGYSESEVLEHDAAAAAAYRDAVRKFHKVRDLYDAARAAQQKVTQ